MSFSLDELNDPQREAVEHVDGPLLILAGPGSGKTRVVTHRIANLLRRGVPSRHILALTFTNKAAEEMRERVDNLMPGESVWISTFHRFCSRLLREHASLVGLGENFTIFDTNDSQRAIAHVMSGLADEINAKQVTPQKLLYAISKCKTELITAENYRPSSRDSVAVMLAKVYPAYQQQLMTANAVDFDDLLLHTVELLRNNEELRRELDERYRYVMVDEYQDTNLAQYAIARALSIDTPNLAVTGDPDQSIYAWRGANIQNILGFERDYPNVKVVRLEHNYRSTPSILSAADSLIRFNRQRKKKSLIAVREDQQPVQLLAFPSQQDEARHIALEIKSLVAKGERSYKDFAIFYRINALSRYLEHGLREFDIPYQVLNGVEFYQRKEVKDVMAYLQLVNNPKNDIAFLRIVNMPPRGLGKVTIGKIADFARKNQISLLDASQQFLGSLSKRAATGLQKFIEMIERCQRFATSPVEEVLGHILSESGYAEYVATSDEKVDEDRGANIQELLTAARQFDMLHDGGDYLEAFLEQTSLVADTDAWEGELDKVTMMTLHGSKGLEFPAVFMVALEQGKLPHERSLKEPDQMEEERRLMFVGLTRARDALTISYAKYRDYRGQKSPAIPSSFLMELPHDEMHVVVPNQPTSPDAWDGVDDMGYEEEVYRDDDLAGDDLSEENLADDALEFDPSMFENDSADTSQDSAVADDSPGNGMSGRETNSSSTAKSVPPASLAGLKTAASLAGEGTATPKEKPPRANPDIFRHGMRVKHPEYGLGKIVALSGEGRNRTATVNFVTAGEKKFMLSRSPLQPVG